MVQWFGLCTFTADCLGSIPAWLRLCTFTAEGLGLIPDGGAATPQAAMWGQKKKKKIIYEISNILINPSSCHYFFGHTCLHFLRKVRGE